MAADSFKPAKPLVLLVQPASDDCEMYADYLRECGFDASPATNSDDAVARAADADVIVTEMRLPPSFHCDGIGLIERLRRDGRTNTKPIIVLTASAFDVDRQRAFAAGCNTFLAKPCLPETLAEEIRVLSDPRARSSRDAAD